MQNAGDGDAVLSAVGQVRRALAAVHDLEPGRVSIRNQRSRWGSCTPGDRTIRLSARLQGMPQWVVDYVIVHELMHLHEMNHSKRFWSVVEGACPDWRSHRDQLKAAARTPTSARRSKTPRLIWA